MLRARRVYCFARVERFEALQTPREGLQPLFAETVGHCRELLAVIDGADQNSHQTVLFRRPNLDGKPFFLQPSAQPGGRLPRLQGRELKVQGASAFDRGRPELGRFRRRLGRGFGQWGRLLHSWRRWPARAARRGSSCLAGSRRAASAPRAAVLPAGPGWPPGAAPGWRHRLLRRFQAPLRAGRWRVAASRWRPGSVFQSCGTFACGSAFASLWERRRSPAFAWSQRGPALSDASPRSRTSTALRAF